LQPVGDHVVVERLDTLLVLKGQEWIERALQLVAEVDIEVSEAESIIRTRREGTSSAYAAHDRPLEWIRIAIARSLLPPDLQTGQRDHSWYISVQFGHYLHESPGEKGGGWELFVKTEPGGKASSY
jgi:hypothetical protein